MRLKFTMPTVSLRSSDNLSISHFSFFFFSWKIIHYEKYFSGITCQKVFKEIQCLNVWGALLGNDKPFGNQTLPGPGHHYSKFPSLQMVRNQASGCYQSPPSTHSPQPPTHKLLSPSQGQWRGRELLPSASA